MLTPPKRQSRAIMADSLFPKDRKKQETQDITLEPAGTRREAMKRSQLALRHLQVTVSQGSPQRLCLLLSVTVTAIYSIPVLRQVT